MSERRDCRITANIETTFAILMERVCEKDGITQSQYVRQLLINDLNARGLLTQALLLRLATTESVEQLERKVADIVAAATPAVPTPCPS